MLKRIKIAVTSIVIIITLMVPVSALLYHQTDAQGLMAGDFTPRLTSDVNDIYYYISTSYLFTPYASNARIGAENWDTTGIDLSDTTSYWSSVCDIKGYDGNTCDDVDKRTLYGYAVIWVGDGPGASNNVPYEDSLQIPADYWGGEVYLNYVKTPSSDATEVMAITSHEVGHVLGLGHVDNTSCIMYPYNNLCTVNTPQDTEKQAVINLYAYR